MRTVQWDENRNEICLIDQRLLPGRFELFICKTLDEVVFAISDMVVRGAPAIGATAAFGMALAACSSTASSADQLRTELRQAAQALNNSRPTAVNLTWATGQMVQFMNQTAGSVVEITRRLAVEAQRIADEDVTINKRMAEIGAELIQDGDTIIHHCNTGALAAVDWGTALGVIRLAHESGKRIHVLVDETRPRLQGARLTAWELMQRGIDATLICDSMAAQVMREGKVQAVVTGADRIAANGDTANKIGTYSVAVLAAAHGIPFYIAAPTSTFDLTLESGDSIPIEQRAPEEITDSFGRRTAPAGVRVYNPAFDVTPARLIRAIVCERGVIRPVDKPSIRAMVGE
jgi:methylthioribose-1-phosphate isomerase